MNPSLNEGEYLGSDISHWQKGIRLEQAKRQGVRFVIAKASQGDYMTDPEFARYMKAARKLGLRVGAYHFLDDAIDPMRQAKLFVDVTQSAGIQGLGLALDVEALNLPDRRIRPKGRHARAFNEAFAKLLPDRGLRLYTSRGYWGSIGNPDAVAMGFEGLWNAMWTGASGPARLIDTDTTRGHWRPRFAGFSRAEIVQFTNSMSAGGRRIDGDLIRGATLDAAWAEFADKAPTKPQDRPEYVKGYSDRLTAAGGLSVVPAPSGANPAYAAGWAEAEGDLLDVLAELKLSGRDGE